MKPSKALFPDEIISGLFSSPKSLFSNLSWIIFGRFFLFFKKYEDHELNNQAKKVRRFFWLILIILVLNFIFQIFYFIL